MIKSDPGGCKRLNIQEQIEKNGTKELPSNETLDGRGTLNSDPVKGFSTAGET